MTNRLLPSIHKTQTIAGGGGGGGGGGAAAAAPVEDELSFRERGACADGSNTTAPSTVTLPFVKRFYHTRVLSMVWSYARRKSTTFRCKRHHFVRHRYEI